MKFDFDSIIDRHSHDSIATDGIETNGVKSVKEGFSVIPMWVADMAFATPGCITDTIRKRLEHPAFGYFSANEDYYNSIINWQREEHGITSLTKDNIGYENSVLGGLVSALNCFASNGDAVLLNSPAYIGFTYALKNNGFLPVYSPLKLDGNGIYRLDLHDMEEKIIKHKIHAAIFCSPHNPTGRVWQKQELEEAMELFKKHNVFVVSDEIWSDIVLNGNIHIPTQSVSADAAQRTVALYAPTKTFNIAGLVGSYHIVYSDYLKDRLDKQSSLSHYNEMNVLSMHALIGAYCEEGREWVKQLRCALGNNVEYACEYINTKFSGVTVYKPEGTYMLFLDCTEWCKINNTDLDTLINKGFEVGVIWQDGRPFIGSCHIRMNVALPFSLLTEAFERLDKYVFNS